VKTLCQSVDERPETDPLDNAADFDPETFDGWLLNAITDNLQNSNYSRKGAKVAKKFK